jgi:tRNA-2-methylthio-N6-dimethylallyladenosine synthase
MPSVYIKTYGCQMNERDSEQVASQLLARGYSLATTEATADVILLNTCSVRDMAEQKALGKMGNLAAEVRKKRPEVVLGFMGCMAQSRGKQLIDQLPDVDLVLGTQKFHRAADYIHDLIQGRRDKVVDIESESGSQATIREHLLQGASGGKSVNAFVSIMQGCNQYCTFCIVPYTRGEERSRTIADIVTECRELVARGVKEVTLLGQIVTSFGRREIPVVQGRSPFVQLIDAVHEIEGLERIRFTSPHPKGYGDDLVEAYARLPKLVESAHIPVQSGSNRLLKAMHRGYTRERFLEIHRKLCGVRPTMGITTDLIVGFPGETESEYLETESLVREAQFDNAFIFRYSPRKDTPAAQLPNPLSEEIKEERNQRLLTLMRQISDERYKACVGRRMQILVEGPSKRNASRMMGRSRCNRIVVFDGSDRHRGQLMDVQITESGSYTLYGDPAVIGME